ncbi:MAG: cob(I)yrinic acid a,c-diamide adenosyltransferase [Candidatus Gottesmanbacteria bacterium]
MSVYTRIGDDGTTALFGGKRILKCEELVDVYGSIDELNSWIGVLFATTLNAKNKKMLGVIQSDLFLIGSTLAGWRGDISSLAKRILDMEQRIDEIEKVVPKLSHFIFPGGSKEAAFVHVARSLTRRVERQMVAFFSKKQHVTKQQKDDQYIIISYLNRLSDLLFMTARDINTSVGVKEVIWKGTYEK